MSVARSRSLAVVVILVVALDWVLKALVQQRLELRVAHPVLDGWVSLKRTVNHGISWGMMGELEVWWRVPLIVALTLLAIGATASIVLASRDRWLRLGGAAVLGGAVGNLGDRLARGGVTDFIHVHAFPFVFNVADVAITCGGVLLVTRMLAGDRRGAEAPA
jgi:signal peptidase II